MAQLFVSKHDMAFISISSNMFNFNCDINNNFNVKKFQKISDEE